MGIEFYHDIKTELLIVSGNTDANVSRDMILQHSDAQKTKAL